MASIVILISLNFKMVILLGMIGANHLKLEEIVKSSNKMIKTFKGKAYLILIFQLILKMNLNGWLLAGGLLEINTNLAGKE